MRLMVTAARDKDAQPPAEYGANGTAQWGKLSSALHGRADKKFGFGDLHLKKQAVTGFSALAGGLI